MSPAPALPGTRHPVPPHGTLHVWGHGGGDAAPLTCLHGFTLTGSSFAELARHLDRPVLAPDLPGHGGTAVHPVDVPTAVAALAAWMGAGPGPGPVLGYSMGGRVALHLAVARPDLVTSLVLVSATPGLDGAAAAERRRQDHALADRIVAGGLDAFLDEWARHPLVGTAHLDAATRARDRELRGANTAAGLAAALRGLGQGASDPVDPHTLTVPALWVAGGRDERYAAVAAAVAGEAAIVVPGAGHNLVSEAAEALGGIVMSWLGAP